jgi:spermidine synthase
VNRIGNSEIYSRSSRQDSKTLLSVLVLIGLTAVIAQIVLMRELMVVFYGNEMSLGLMLACWLLWTAIGSSASGRLATRTSQPRRLMALLEVLVALAFPLAIFLVRASKAAFQSIPGEILGPGPMIFTSLLVLSAFCLVSGGLFAAGSQLYAREVGTSTPAGTSRVYLLEAVGSGLGGMLASLVLIRYFQPFEIAALLSLLNFLGATSLTVRSKLPRRAALGTLLAIFVFLVFPIGCRWLEQTSLGRLWRGYHLIATRNSVYGNLAVVQTEGIRSLFENGLVSFNVPDPLAAEEAVHFALLQHASPKSLLLVGGGVNGSLAQALQHSSLERIDYVELDPTILALAQEFFPAESAPIRLDPRVRVHNTDGRLFLKTTDLKFDVVIVNLPDPQTAQLNRFYTLEFFREVANKLTPSGVFSFQLKGAEDYISPELGEFLRCIHKTLQEVFPEVMAIPGDTIHFFASPQVGALTVDSGELIARLRARHIRTSYLREYYLPYRMMPDRMLDLESQLRPQADTRANHDFAPVAYYFDVALWSTRFNRAYRRIFETMGHLRFGPLLASLALTLVGLAACVRWLPMIQDRLRTSAGFCVAAMGFTLIGLEMLLLLGFQAIYGYVYQQLAIIIAGFMVGMALGSWWGLRPASSEVRATGDIRVLVVLQFLAATSSLFLYLLLHTLAAAKKLPAIFLVSQVIFPLLAVLCGLLGGYQFPIASRIFFARSKGNAGSPGTVYALDLAGACLGALLLSSYLVPVFGFQQTAWLMAVVNLAPAFLVGLLALGKQGFPE